MSDKRKKELYSAICKIYDDFKGIEDNKAKFFLIECYYKAKDELLFLDWKEKYGIDITDHYGASSGYIKLNKIMSITYISDGYKDKEKGSGKFISNSKKQPIDEWLLSIRFPTGAYIFGEDNPIDLFKKFYEELKSYNPDYTDDLNRELYWKIDNASTIYHKFQDIFNKYLNIYKKEAKKRKINMLKEKLRKLEKED